MNPTLEALLARMALLEGAVMAMRKELAEAQAHQGKGDEILLGLLQRVSKLEVVVRDHLATFHKHYDGRLGKPEEKA